MPQINTPDIKSQAIVGSKLSNTIAIPSGATCATAGSGDNDNSLASTAFVQQEINANTTYFSDTFTGTGTALDPIDIDSSLFAVTAGTYTPTLTNTTNVTSSTPAVCHYFKIGNQVTVSGKVLITPTAASDTVLGISLPIASNFAATTDCSGIPNSVYAGSFSYSEYIEGNATSNIAELKFTAVATGVEGSVFFIFTYTVI